MKLKTDADGKPVLDGELPVYVDDKGQEQAIHVGDLVGKVNTFSRDLDKLRKQAKSAEEKLASYSDLDVEAARKALETVQNLDQKKLIDAGEVEKVKAAAKEGYDRKLAEIQKTIAEREGTIRQLAISSRIGASQWLTKNTLLTPDLFEARFGGQFRYEDGATYAVDSFGNKIMSRKNPGEPADVDEAIERIIGDYPARDSILRTTGAKGTGTGGNGDGGGGGNGAIRRKADLKTPAEKSAWIAKQRESRADGDGFAAYRELAD